MPKPRGTLAAVAFLLSFAIACSEPKNTNPQMSRTPVSIRGWIRDIETPPSDFYRLTKSTTGANQFRIEQFQQTTVFVENVQFASGGVAENGSFILLDVPPGNIRIVFSAPNVASSMIELKNVPPNADVLLPALNVTNSGAKLLDPRAVVVRVPDLDSDKRSFGPLSVQGFAAPVKRVSIRELIDRRDYPNPR